MVEASVSKSNLHYVSKVDLDDHILTQHSSYVEEQKALQMCVFIIELDM